MADETGSTDAVSDVDDTSTGDADDVIVRRIGDWQTRLLQLNHRNNLLYFNSGRSAVGIIGIAPDELDERLRRSRTGLEFPYMPPSRAQRRGLATADEPDSQEEPRVREGDLRTDCEPVDLQRRLRNLRRRDREWEEEQGLNILFLAMGFLNWDRCGWRARAFPASADSVRSGPYVSPRPIPPASSG